MVTFRRISAEDRDRVRGGLAALAMRVEHQIRPMIIGEFTRFVTRDERTFRRRAANLRTLLKRQDMTPEMLGQYDAVLEGIEQVLRTRAPEPLGGNLERAIHMVSLLVTKGVMGAWAAALKKQVEVMPTSALQVLRIGTLGDDMLPRGNPGADAAFASMLDAITGGGATVDEARAILREHYQSLPEGVYLPAELVAYLEAIGVTVIP